MGVAHGQDGDYELHKVRNVSCTCYLAIKPSDFAFWQVISRWLHQTGFFSNILPPGNQEMEAAGSGLSCYTSHTLDYLLQISWLFSSCPCLTGFTLGPVLIYNRLSPQSHLWLQWLLLCWLLNVSSQNVFPKPKNNAFNCYLSPRCPIGISNSTYLKANSSNSPQLSFKGSFLCLLLEWIEASLPITSIVTARSLVFLCISLVISLFPLFL